MKKLELPKKKIKVCGGNGTTTALVRTSTMDLINDVLAETGLSKVELLDRMIKFACENINFVEGEN